jgi:hypothetical protein
MVLMVLLSSSSATGYRRPSSPPVQCLKHEDSSGSCLGRGDEGHRIVVGAAQTAWRESNRAMETRAVSIYTVGAATEWCAVSMAGTSRCMGGQLHRIV